MIQISKTRDVGDLGTTLASWACGGEDHVFEDLAFHVELLEGVVVLGLHVSDLISDRGLRSFGGS